MYSHSTLLPVGMAHGRKFLVMRSCQNSDHTSDHGKDACRGRKEQLDRSLFFHRGGGVKAGLGFVGQILMMALFWAALC